MTQEQVIETAKDYVRKETKPRHKSLKEWNPDLTDAFEVDCYVAGYEKAMSIVREILDNANV